MKPKDLKKTVSAKKASLGHVLKKNKKIKVTVKKVAEARDDLAKAQAKRRGWRLAVLFIDIDKFKNINDSYGHDLGDQELLPVVLLKNADTAMYKAKRKRTEKGVVLFPGIW